jgi:hypothetical protein
VAQSLEPRAVRALALLATLFIAPAARCGRDTVNGSFQGPGEWTARAPLPTARQEMPSVHLAGRIYTAGGFDADRAASAVLEIYDVAQDR